MPPPGRIFSAPPAELNAKLKAHEISVLELTRAFSARLEDRTAVQRPARADEQALRRAARLTTSSDAGVADPGIPFAVKDLLSYAGRTT
jgi:Asp-tRNA(Asn)/Glu-tRNA(Gln) amidotransferase A subunit family amidase